MKGFREYIKEAYIPSLNVFDIDDTLFTTKTMINIMKDGKVVKSITNREYNDYKLKDGESYDFAQFRNASTFAKQATPIGRMIAKMKKLIRNATAKGSKVIISTARADFDNKKVFLDALAAHGIDVDKIYVERSGNLQLGSAAKNKKAIFRKYLRGGKYRLVRFFDDDIKNITSFLSLEKELGDVELEAWHVQKDGRVKKAVRRSR